MTARLEEIETKAVINKMTAFDVFRSVSCW
jgi:hypothetical protein